VPVPRRPGVALDGDDLVTAAGEGTTHEQPSRTGSDDHDPHGAPAPYYRTGSVLTTLIVSPR
jgi:hypothetical protein